MSFAVSQHINRAIFQTKNYGIKATLYILGILSDFDEAKF